MREESERLCQQSKEIASGVLSLLEKERERAGRAEEKEGEAVGRTKKERRRRTVGSKTGKTTTVHYVSIWIVLSFYGYQVGSRCRPKERA